MPELSTLVVFAAAGLALVAIPGPNHVYIVTRSLAQGRSAGLASAFGVECGTLVHIAAAAVGLSALIASSALAFDVVRYLGAAYLIFLDGLLVKVLNPKVALFFLAFLPQVRRGDRRRP